MSHCSSIPQGRRQKFFSGGGKRGCAKRRERHEIQCTTVVFSMISTGCIILKVILFVWLEGRHCEL